MSMTLEQAREGARRDARRYGVRIAVTVERPDTPDPEYGWCPPDAFMILHGAMARAGLARIVEEVQP